MPTYEYRCTRCDHGFERVQKVGSPAPACPECGGRTRKVYSSVGLIFKGKGFHTTDYRKPASTDNGEARPAAAEDAARPSAAAKDTAAPGTQTTKDIASKERSKASKDAAPTSSVTPK